MIFVFSWSNLSKIEKDLSYFLPKPHLPFQLDLGKNVILHNSYSNSVDNNLSSNYLTEHVFSLVKYQGVIFSNNIYPNVKL